MSDKMIRIAACATWTLLAVQFAHATETRAPKHIFAEKDRIAVEFVWNVDVPRCQLFDVGKLSEVVPAQHGKLNFERSDLPLPPPTCAGSSFTADVAYYTWDSSPSDQMDTFTLRYVPSKGGSVVEFPIVIYAPLAIANATCRALIDGHIRLALVDEHVSLLVERVARRARPVASFTPGSGMTLSQTAKVCGYDSFSWTQVVTASKTRRWGTPPLWDGASNIDSPFRQEPFFYGVGPVWSEKYPSYPYTVANHTRTSPAFCPKGEEWHREASGDETLCYTDLPTDTDEHESESFISALVGVTVNADGSFSASVPLAKWVWRDDMNKGTLFSKDGKLMYVGCIQILLASSNISVDKRVDRC